MTPSWMLCLVAANAIFAPPREQDVLIPARDGRQLAGTLTLPAVGHPPFPVAISLTGSGAHHRDGNRAPAHPYRPFREIANALADKGIAMLRMDDRELAPEVQGEMQRRFDALQPGQALQLVSDHDPQPLRHRHRLGRVRRHLRLKGQAGRLPGATRHHAATRVGAVAHRLLR